jgi:hypothetical protein
MAFKVTAVVPPFVRVAFNLEVVEPTCAVPKFNSDGDTTRLEPMPESKTVCGLVSSLSVMVNVPVRVPSPVGLKVTFALQKKGRPGFGGSGAVQVFVTEKSAPDRLNEVNERDFCVS